MTLSILKSSNRSIRTGRVLVALVLAGSLMLGACSGRITVDVNMDEETGDGFITITGLPDFNFAEEQPSEEEEGEPSTLNLTLPLLLALILGGFLILLALILLLIRRPRSHYAGHEGPPPQYAQPPPPRREEERRDQ